jgi:hypothetical protein
MANRMTAEEIEARVWAFVIVSLVVILLGSMAMFLYSVSFVTQPMSGLAPIDKVYTQQISTIMVFVSGVLGGVAGRSGVKAVAKAVASAEATDNDPPPKPVSTWTGRPPAPNWVNNQPSPPKAKVADDEDEPAFKGAKE